MRLVKLWLIAAFAVLAFGAVGSAVASAEDGSPEVLCLVRGCALELEGEFLIHKEEKDKPTLETLGGVKLEATDAHIVIKKCDDLPNTEEKDTNLCKDQLIVFQGVEEPKNKVKCENKGALKEGEVKLLVDLHLAAEEVEKKLEPLLLAKVLGGATGTELVSPLEYKCGILPIKVRGTFACLVLRGLVNILANEMVEILCKMKLPGDPEIGKCELLCEWLEKEPLEITNLKGVFEDAWLLLHLLGAFNKDIFIDD